MSHLPKVLNSLAGLLSYPGEQTAQRAELLYVLLQGELDAAAREAAAFGGFVERHELAELEEHFTRTFDVNPACALEVGWHLFGEEYARGMFLVRMRQELRKYGLVESRELPDHISHVLAVAAAMPPDEAARFVRACVQAAVEKMNAALAGQHDNPYRHVVACLAQVLAHVWGAPDGAPPGAVAGGDGAAAPFPSDPLHAFPVADVCGAGCGCPSSCGEDQLLQLSAEPHAPAQTTKPTGTREP